jgi:uronate dehydrogenase
MLAAVSLILITGAAGRIGTYLRRGLPPLGWRLRLLDVRQPDNLAADEEAVVADITDTASVYAAVRGVDAVVHLAGVASEAPFADICAANIVGTQTVFEAARRAGVRRIAYTSSNHAVGFTPRQPVVPADVPIRPDTYYGVSKAFGEALARFFVDRYGMRIACLRIGSCEDEPSSVRSLSTWLSPGDAVRLAHACLTAANLDFAIVYGISANTRGWWDLGPGRVLGYQPADNAEEYAPRVLAAAGGELSPDDPDYAWLGGRFTEMTPEP